MYQHFQLFTSPSEPTINAFGIFIRLAIFIAGMTTGMAFRHTLNKLACTKLPKSTPTRCLSTSLNRSKRFNLFSKVKIMSINRHLAKFGVLFMKKCIEAFRKTSTKSYYVGSRKACWTLNIISR